MCVWRASCCIWCALKQFICTITIDSSKPLASCGFQNNNQTRGITVRVRVRFMNPLKNYIPLQVHECMCHCCDNSLFLSTRKPDDYHETLDEGTATGWGFTDDHPPDS